MQAIKKVVNYALMIGLIIFLLWFSLSNIEVAEGESKIDFLLTTWNSADKSFLLISGFFAVLSHFVRGLRWKLLLNSLGYKTKSMDNFYSVMIGYFINLVIPRGGEISRCYNMYKLGDVPSDISIGSVIAERLIDLVLLIGFITAAFFIEFDNLFYFIQELNLNEKIDPSMYLVPIIILIVLGLLGIITIRFILKSNNEKIVNFRLRIIEFLKGIKKGFLAVVSLKEKGLFFFYSTTIWMLYYLMTTSVMYAFPETDQLGFYAAVSIFAIGGIAMAVPLPGGAGSYHALVPLGLVLLYGLEDGKAVAFTFIFHGWQTFVVIVFGALSLLVSQYKIQKKKNADRTKNTTS